MPYPFVIDGSDLILDRSMTAGLAQHFPTTDLAKIGDGITDGIDTASADFPLSHFDALRTDFSLARLKHYTGTPAEYIQPYILFTNYSRYVDEFVSWACEQILDPTSPYIALSCAGGSYITAETADPERTTSDLGRLEHYCCGTEYRLNRRFIYCAAVASKAGSFCWRLTRFTVRCSYRSPERRTFDNGAYGGIFCCRCWFWSIRC